MEQYFIQRFLESWNICLGRLSELQEECKVVHRPFSSSVPKFFGLSLDPNICSPLDSNCCQSSIALQRSPWRFLFLPMQSCCDMGRMAKRCWSIALLGLEKKFVTTFHFGRWASEASEETTLYSGRNHQTCSGSFWKGSRWDPFRTTSIKRIWIKILYESPLKKGSGSDPLQITSKKRIWIRSFLDHLH